MTNILIDRAVVEQALKALRCVDLQSLVPDYGSGHYSVARLDGPQVKSAITAMEAALAEPTIQTCNCRWDGEVQVQQCTLHEAHVDAIHEWAERAKVAEKKLAALAEPQEPFCYVYEYDSPYGLHREFYPREYNGMKPSRTVPLYTAPHQPAEPVQEPFVLPCPTPKACKAHCCTPRGKGYSACCNGIPKECNPYYVRLLISGLQDFYESGEWIAGWNQAYNENKFGINLNDKTL